jgi:tetratricopeptide (TPR) repeat protein
MCDSEDSDDDLGAFGFLAKGIIVVDDVEEEGKVALHTDSGDFTISSEVCQKVDELLLMRDTEAVELLLRGNDEGNTSEEKNVCRMCKLILEGKHLDLLQEHSPDDLSTVNLMNLVVMEGDCVAQVRNRVFNYISCGADAVIRECRAVECLLLAATYLELYCQENYTGPELSRDSSFLLYASKDNVAIKQRNNGEEFDRLVQGVDKQAKRYLECDGLYTFPHCVIPHTLLIARCIFTTLADPQRNNWQRGIVLDEEGTILKSTHSKAIPALFTRATLPIRSRHWHCARSAMTHGRVLQKLTYQAVPTLWNEAQAHFDSAKAKLGVADIDRDSNTIKREHGKITILGGGGDGDGDGGSTNTSTTGTGKVGSRELPVEKALLVTQLMLECGLCLHHFASGDQGKKYFAQAQLVSGLTTELSGAMGKRTKFQQDDHAQLFLRTESSLHRASGMAAAAGVAAAKPPLTPTAEEAAAATAEAAAAADKKQQQQEEETGSSWQHSEWELGRGMVREVAATDGSGSTEVAAVREVMLDSQDGGAQENILLEGGAKFTESVDRGSGLHPVDQAVVLALCIDVSNSNPADGLTREEMEPYLVRLLESANNWMIHSTGLLERSWLEFEKRKTMDRAMLQIQALLDQHTTKLTIMQSTHKAAVEDSAPVQDRMKYLHCIVYPSQYELKRDLAHRYLSCQVVASALQYFRELHMWSEVITCYQLMQKPHRAEMVVRERIQEEGKTPYMLTSLADLTNDTSLYEEAWELSNGRYARAKRTMAKIAFDNGDFAACVRHSDQALEVQPLKATAWYVKGLACTRLGRYQDALHAFARCIQQEDDIGEAWANCGSIHMHLGDYAKAHSAMEEAFKSKRDSWRLMENLMNTSLMLGKWADCIGYMERLLDQRDKSDRPWHQDELKRLSLFVTSINRAEVREKKRLQLAGAPAVEVAAVSVIDVGKKNFMEDLKRIVETESKDEEDGDGGTSMVIVMDAELSYPSKRLEDFFFRLTGTLSSDPALWDLFADFELSLGRLGMVLECRVKQYRTLLAEPRWEQEECKVGRVASAASVLVAVHYTTTATDTHIFACNSLLASTLRKINELFPDSEHSAKVQQLQREVAAIAAKRNVKL